ncbi:MAG: xanthine dehydrogenase family protein molybdopterin-binding subunit [bacterium]|nr:xanthine dehydrogenase family protein molybdopterin-binding subunit [Gammaproteobacteria bacterium]
MTDEQSYEQIGKPLGRVEGPEKVTGTTLYPGDIRLPGMLVGKCLRSPYPHARILSIDTSAAIELPGVHAVITAKDLPDHKVGRMLRDFEPLATDRVLFVGQKIAAVAAENQDIAREAIALIDVDYEPLPAILDIESARANEAPVLHPDFDKYVGRMEEPRAHPNNCAEISWRRGDVEQGFASADHVIEHTFRTQRQHQGYIEPHACIVNIEADGHVQVWANSKAPFQLRGQIAGGIGLTSKDVTVLPSPIGGDFGGKGGFMDTHVAYWLSRACGRPIMITMDYTEELTAGNPRHGAVMTFKTGVMMDGTIVARQADLVYDSGAFGAFRPGKGSTYGARCLDPYRVNHALINSSLVYTNLVPCGSMRSPGDPQSIFAGETHIDLIAREIGMDPLAFRLKNVVRQDDLSPLGIHWQDPIPSRVLEAAAEAINYENRKNRTEDGRAVGIGFSICNRNTGGGNATARVTISANASITLNISLRDTGSGFYTMLRQIIGEELGIPYDQIQLQTWSTDAIETDGGVGGARVTNAAGNAVLEAAASIRQQLNGYLTNKYSWAPDDIKYSNRQVRHQGSSIELSGLMHEIGSDITAEVTYIAPPPEGTVFTAQAAEVAIDEETGEIEVLHFVTAHDVGTILNPTAHQGQVEGGFAQGLGYTLFEEIMYEEGYVLNAHLGDYKLPTMRDMPKLTTIHVRAEVDGPTPYGGKGIGEQSVSGVAPAIVNAILDATGKSMRALPVTSEKMLDALDQNVKTPLAI